MRSVTRRTQSVRELRRQETFEAVLAGLHKALSEGATLSSLSVGELATLGGISRSRFYAHFRDKGEFLCAWLDHVRDELFTGASAWWDLGPDPSYADVRGALGQLASAYDPHALVMSALVDAAAYDEMVDHQLSRFAASNVAALTRHIERGQRQGWVDQGILPAATAEWLMCMTERALAQTLAQTSPPEFERQIDTFAYIVWHSLYAPEATSPIASPG